MDLECLEGELIVGGNENDTGKVMTRELFHRFKPGHSRHLDVEQEQVRKQAAGGFNGGRAVGRLAYNLDVTLGIQSATLQDLSDGRLLLGLGVANKTIASWHNGVFDRPLRRAREYIEIVRKVVPELVMIDDGFTCQSHPIQPRVTLRDIHAIQQELRTSRSVVLAPGESWTVTRKVK